MDSHREKLIFVWDINVGRHLRYQSVTITVGYVGGMWYPREIIDEDVEFPAQRRASRVFVFKVCERLSTLTKRFLQKQHLQKYRHPCDELQDVK